MQNIDVEMLTRNAISILINKREKAFPLIVQIIDVQDNDSLFLGDPVVTLIISDAQEQTMILALKQEIINEIIHSQKQPIVKLISGIIHKDFSFVDKLELIEYRDYIITNGENIENLSNKDDFKEKVKIKLKKKTQQQIKRQRTFDNKKYSVDKSENIIEQFYETIQSFIDLPLEIQISLVAIVGYSRAQQIKTKFAKEVIKCNYIIIDKELESIEFIYWKAKSLQDIFKVGTIIGIQGAKLQMFQDKKQITAQLSTNVITQKEKLYHLQEFQELQQIINNKSEQLEEAMVKGKEQYRLKTVQWLQNNMKNQNNEQFKCRAELKGIIYPLNNSNTFFLACPKCFKKVEKVIGSFLYYCKQCANNLIEICYRYYLTIKFIDQTGCIYVQSTNELGNQLLNLNAHDFSELTDKQQQDLLHKSIQFSRVIIQASFQQYNGNNQPRYYLQEIIEEEPLEEAKDIYQNIRQLQKQLDNLKKDK